MKTQKQHNPKRFEGLHSSQFYECRHCGIKYLGLAAFTKHNRDKHSRKLLDFLGLEETINGM